MAEYEFEFKQLKRHLKVTPTIDGERQEPFKLTLLQWKAVSEATPKSRYTHGRPHVRVDAYSSEDSLLSSGVTASASYTRKYMDYRGRKVTSELTDRCALSDMGIAMQGVMPKCPPRDQWPEPPKSALSSPTNVRLTKHQEAVINTWTKRLSKALPVGSSELESSRWQSPECAGKSTIAALLRQGLIEPGVVGLKVVNGNVELADRVGEIYLVYRLTVLGAMYTENL